MQPHLHPGNLPWGRFMKPLEGTPAGVYRIRCRSALAAAVTIMCAATLLAQPSSWQHAVEQAAHVAPEARIVVLDAATGHFLAAHRLGEAARTLAAPGSTLKPLVLYGMLAAGRWNPQNRVACDRRLAVAGHRLACTHPPAPPFDARAALAWSCNSYFAQVARTLGPGELRRLLQPTGLLGATGLAAYEATAELRDPRTVDEEQLALLGVTGARVTPLELAVAYRWLALEFAAHPDSVATQTVRAGLQDSASFGMAGAANLGGVPVAGKTGTAEGETTSQTHGWFAGMAPAQNPRIVICVYLPAGRGAEAARLAGDLLARAPLAHASPTHTSLRQP
jgi:cell division protein FtsI/penicillin-binding protein 2